MSAQTAVQRDGEPFSAMCDCPSCGLMAVHWLEHPRIRPDVETPAERGLRMVNETIWSMSMIADVQLAGFGIGTRPRATPRWYDPPETVVARVCTACGYRWGQR